MSLRPQPARDVPEETVRIARAAFPKGCLAMRLRDALGQVFTDEQFAQAFPTRGGPGLSPGELALVSVLQFAEGLSDRQAAEAVRGRIDWKYALALELTDPGFDFSVLSEFRDRLISHELEEEIFQALLDHCARLGLLRAGGRQRTDSTHVIAAVRTLNRMEFVGETLRSALEALAVAAPDWLASIITGEWIERYGSRVDNYRFPKGEDARQRWALTVGADGFTLLEAVHHRDAPAWLRQLPAVQTLRIAWIQQYHREEKGVRWREGRDLPPARRRLSSPYDPDAHYGLKRGAGWCGYKVHLSETCEPDAPHLLTGVQTTDATVADSEVTEQIHTDLTRRGLRPDMHAVDAGYISATLILTAREEHAIDLLGPVGLDTHTTGKDGLGQEAFTIDWKARTATCPGGATSVSWSDQRKPNGTPITRVHFSITDCAPCPFRAACTKADGHRYGRSLTLLPAAQQQILDQRRREQETDAWKARHAVRAGAEGTISQAVRTGAIRRTRYRGLPKTRLAHLLTATAINLIRLDAWWTGTPIRGTRNSHLERLGASLGLAA
ncbi:MULTISPECIES: IS1182 family transposase [unclassified Nonomuraea]|uniref:IS1182 family transposase n=1 Tax=unclassified Nonomuraea TaxID=2593643 RepID=UPI003261573D